MNIKLLFSGIAIGLILLAFSPVQAMDTRCAECGMKVMMDSKFSSRIVQGDTVLYFCDIGDLFSYLKKTRLNNARAEVKDYITGEWIDARKAYYANSSKKFSTPMGWGIAAFKDKNEASKAGTVVDFDGTAKALK